MVVFVVGIVGRWFVFLFEVCIFLPGVIFVRGGRSEERETRGERVRSGGHQQPHQVRVHHTRSSSCTSNFIKFVYIKPHQVRVRQIPSSSPTSLTPSSSCSLFFLSVTRLPGAFSLSVTRLSDVQQKVRAFLSRESTLPQLRCSLLPIMAPQSMSYHRG